MSKGHGFTGCTNCYKKKRDCKCIIPDFHIIQKQAFYYNKFIENYPELKENISGCGKYLGTAFDNPYMKVYCGNEIYGGETIGLFVKLCQSCKSKKDNQSSQSGSKTIDKAFHRVRFNEIGASGSDTQTPKEDIKAPYTDEGSRPHIVSNYSNGNGENKTSCGDNWTLGKQIYDLEGKYKTWKQYIKVDDVKLFLKKLKEEINVWNVNMNGQKVINVDILNGIIKDKAGKGLEE